MAFAERLGRAVEVSTPEAALSTEQKALKINLASAKHGAFAEIGAGQEVV
jgi:hypothetical protein